MKTKFGVIVGRWQTPSLHLSHAALINYVKRKSDHLILLVGVARALGTKSDPLDFRTRHSMLLQSFPQATILPISDENDDTVWSNKLDNMVASIASGGSVTLYGGRDSFIPHYQGRYPTKEVTVDDVPELKYTESATQIRQSIKHPAFTSDFRQGVIYAVNNSFARVYTTVDIAVVRGEQVLMGRKRDESHIRFPGGFVDPTDASFEAAAARELKEETGIYVRPDSLSYISSHQLDDWRYRKEEKVFTTLFGFHYKSDCGLPPVADDDLASVYWHEISHREVPNNVAPVHVPLYMALQKWVRKK